MDISTRDASPCAPQAGLGRLSMLWTGRSLALPLVPGPLPGWLRLGRLPPRLRARVGSREKKVSFRKSRALKEHCRGRTPWRPRRRPSKSFRDNTRTRRPYRDRRPRHSCHRPPCSRRRRTGACRRRWRTIHCNNRRRPDRACRKWRTCHGTTASRCCPADNDSNSTARLPRTCIPTGRSSSR